MQERWAVLAQYVLPKQVLTQWMGRMAGARGGSWTTAAIRWFVGRYGVDMSEAAEPDVAAYATQQRHGAVSQFGSIQSGRIFQAKGHDYSATALLGGDALLAARFDAGSFATIYLSPKDYHRIHMPRAGRLVRMVHVPGDLFSVNPTTARGVPGLFARNERVVCVFEDPQDAQCVWALV